MISIENTLSCSIISYYKLLPWTIITPYLLLHVHHARLSFHHWRDWRRNFKWPSIEKPWYVRFTVAPLKPQAEVRWEQFLSLKMCSYRTISFIMHNLTYIDQTTVYKALLWIKLETLKNQGKFKIMSQVPLNIQFLVKTWMNWLD